MSWSDLIAECWLVGVLLSALSRPAALLSGVCDDTGNIPSRLPTFRTVGGIASATDTPSLFCNHVPQHEHPPPYTHTVKQRQQPGTGIPDLEALCLAQRPTVHFVVGRVSSVPQRHAMFCAPRHAGWSDGPPWFAVATRS